MFSGKSLHFSKGITSMKTMMLLTQELWQKIYSGSVEISSQALR